MILMLYLQLACLLSLVLQIVGSKFGLEIKEGQSCCCDFFLLYGVLPPRPRPQRANQATTVGPCRTASSYSFTLYYNTKYVLHR